MSELTGIKVTLTTAADEDAGTDDHLYIGVIGSGGGREFPLDDPDQDDFELEPPVTYKLGAPWEPINVSFLRFPRQSKPGQVNDPAFMPLELELVYGVYVRKQGDNTTEDDDAYRLRDLEVVLYGPAAPLKRTFRLRVRNEGPWLANENGHVVYLAEVGGGGPGIGAD
jgi:PLAT/LH2 domain